MPQQEATPQWRNRQLDSKAGNSTYLPGHRSRSPPGSTSVRLALMCDNKSKPSMSASSKATPAAQTFLRSSDTANRRRRAFGLSCGVENFDGDDVELKAGERVDSTLAADDLAEARPLVLEVGGFGGRRQETWAGRRHPSRLQSKPNSMARNLLGNTRLPGLRTLGVVVGRAAAACCLHERDARVLRVVPQPC